MLVRSEVQAQSHDKETLTCASVLSCQSLFHQCSTIICLYSHDWSWYNRPIETSVPRTQSHTNSI